MPTQCADAKTEDLEAAPALVASPLAILPRIARETVFDRVYEALRRSLIEGTFDAGEVLRIQDVAQRLEVSTMPVREALGRLVSERALEALPNRSIRVPLLTRLRLDEVAHARALVEGEAAAIASARIDRAALDELKRITEAYDRLMAKVGSHSDRAAYNHAFHFAIYRTAGSSVLLPIIESLWLQSGPFIRAAAEIYDGDDGLSATHHHWQIVEALERADPDAARRAVGADINRAFDLLRERLPFPEESRP
ncbi:GntR family transcriptional regulator [Antarcticirhabdus aurantiaca]|uniref:GntR family transcriptional regulator n=1 Tax=Antarcticirhabdus aurantiaca TaxID=2606717 RepID=A0ACD4NML4_9HYPH|nr:GntR family transcriptional regulator [Antarcticirhabdus aurantiaca]WAJ28125.1 GntR family transcriptional regulator [Jeongeuplla avenae]